MNAQFKTRMAQMLAAAGVVLILVVWLTLEGAFPFVTLAFFYGQGDA